MDFEKFNKIPRLSRDIVITEKIDGTNAQIYLCRHNELMEHFPLIDGGMQIKNEPLNNFVDKYCLYKTVAVTDENDIIYMFSGSRKKWLDVSSKGDNFAFAKWVQANGEELLKLGEGRHYGEWYGHGIQRNYGLKEKKLALFNVHKWDDPEVRPKCCDVVPTLYTGAFDTLEIDRILSTLRLGGSDIVPGFMNPEGIIIYHTASGKLFKKTIHDDQGKNEKDKICS